MEITPIISVDKYIVGNNEAGEITSKLHQAYLDAATGRIKEYSNWITPIY